MQLQELSESYGQAARAITLRIAQLRQMERSEPDERKKARLHRRILDLRPMQEQCRDLEQLTAHYYDRRYGRNGKYRV